MFFLVRNSDGCAHLRHILGAMLARRLGVATGKAKVEREQRWAKRVREGMTFVEPSCWNAARSCEDSVEIHWSYVLMHRGDMPEALFKQRVVEALEESGCGCFLHRADWLVVQWPVPSL
mmetsp:Transcript_127303/g.291105  ORF Transcript_127303/g.291105 Transcript_127303/m.291105 type:complete len:119 (+) Transcript_127303:283-639(+)